MSIILSLLAAAALTSGDPQAAYLGCIHRTALRYAQGKESAEAIADATISACANEEAAVQDATIADLNDHKVRGDRAVEAWTNEIQPHLREKARSDALRYVIEARLPKKRR